MKPLPMKNQINRILDSEFRTTIIEIKSKCEQVDISQKIYILSRAAVLEAVINPNDTQTRKERNEKARRLLELTRSLIIQVACPELIPSNSQYLNTSKSIQFKVLNYSQAKSTDSRMTGSKSSTSIQQFSKNWGKKQNQSPDDNQSVASTIRDCEITPYQVDQTTNKKTKQLFNDIEQTEHQAVCREDRINTQQNRGFKNVSNSLKKSLERAMKNQDSFNQFLSSLQKA